jgi:hypothetical protein
MLRALLSKETRFQPELQENKKLFFQKKEA